ncbi:MAG: chromosomal replication initiator protein DnaA [Alphaproteobacteria bacterium]
MPALQEQIMGSDDRTTPVDWVQKDWDNISTRLRQELGEAAFRSWLVPLKVAAGGQPHVITIKAPTRFLRDWVASHYADRIRTLWCAENTNISDIEIIIEAVLRSESRPSSLPVRAVATPVIDSPTIEIIKREEEADPNVMLFADPEAHLASLDERFTFENFVVGKPNELAHAAARRVAESSIVPFNPLFLYGGVGLGKTHLMHAIAWAIHRRTPERQVIYLSAEKFMYQFVKALRFKDVMAFKEQFRSVDVLMIDDIQFICGKDSTQEEFFHTFNALVDQNRQIIISADKSPSDLEGMEERLRSRLGWGLVADIHPTTYELRLGILQMKCEVLQKTIPQKVLEYLAHRISSNVRELEGALNRIVAHAELVGRPVTLETCQEVLRDLLRANDRRLSIDEIQRKVAEHYNIRVADMFSERRSRAIARPRQIAMYLCKMLTAKSLPEIGRKFGGRDHTTVMHAVRKIEELMESEAGVAEDVELLRRALG